jgi:glutaredoxin
MEKTTMRASPFTAAALAVALSVALEAPAQTSVYKWTDADGKVHFSDMPPPPGITKNITEKRMGGGVVEASQLPYETQMAMKSSPVTLYTAPQCGAPCDEGRTLLGNRGIPYTERNAQASAEDAEAVKKAIGALQVPVLLVGGDALKGFDPNAWNGALDGAGYPRTKPPGTLAPRPVVAGPASSPAPDAAAEPPR